jgi:hypothetical protein
MSTGEPDATEIGHVRFGGGPSEKDQVNWHLVGGLPYRTPGSAGGLGNAPFPRMVTRPSPTRLINPDHDRVLRRGEVQGHHIVDLSLQLGVAGELEPLNPVRPQAEPLPASRDRVMADPDSLLTAQPVRQPPRPPVRHPAARSDFKAGVTVAARISHTSS